VVAAFLIAEYSRRDRHVAVLRPIAGQNVLLVTIDTLRADALGSYGGPAATPNLDRLARQGVRYDFAHAHAVVTLPSHTSILTGRYPFEHGVRDNSGYRLAAATPTIATLLKAAGYHTAAFIGGFPLNARFGLTRGFDVYDDRMGEAHGPIEFALPERRAEAVIATAQAWIRTQPDQWFAWVHLFDPHAPYAPPAPFNRQYADRPYDGEVAYVDQALAPLFESVKSQARPTFIVVTADHGEALGDHGEATHGLFAYESTLRVPLILAQHIPGQEAPERTEASSVPVRHVDLLPTMLSAVSLPAPAGVPGRSLLQASDTEGDASSTSYFEAMSASLNRGWAPLQGILAGREKLISLPLTELYRLSNDPHETTNLSGREPDRRRVREARRTDWHASTAGARGAEDPETVARLRSLGYAAGGNAKKHSYTEDDDPKRLIDVDAAIHRGIDLYERDGRSRPSRPTGRFSRAGPIWRSPSAIWRFSTGARATRTRPSIRCSVRCLPELFSRAFRVNSGCISRRPDRRRPHCRSCRPRRRIRATSMRETHSASLTGTSTKPRVRSTAFGPYCGSIRKTRLRIRTSRRSRCGAVISRPHAQRSSRPSRSTRDRRERIPALARSNSARESGVRRSTAGGAPSSSTGPITMRCSIWQANW